MLSDTSNTTLSLSRAETSVFRGRTLTGTVAPEDYIAAILDFGQFLLPDKEIYLINYYILYHLDIKIFT